MIEERNEAIKKYNEIMQKVIQAMKEQEDEIDRLNALKNSI